MQKQKQLMKEAEKLGWEYCRSGGDHYRMTHPVTGSLIFLPSTLGRGRAWQNSIQLLRRGATRRIGCRGQEL